MRRRVGQSKKHHKKMGPIRYIMLDVIEVIERTPYMVMFVFKKKKERLPRVKISKYGRWRTR